MIDFAEARQMMVDGQIRTNDVTDQRVLQAFLDVPREVFLPENKDLAYLDRDLSLGGGRFLTKPMVFAKLLQAAAIGPEERVLVVGCATGYGAAIVARLCREVWALESDPELAKAAGRSIARMPATNVKVVTGPLEEGWPAESPYDAVVIDGAVEVLPETLVLQTAPNGRIACVLRERPPGRGMIFRLSDGKMSAHAVFDASAPLLPPFARRPEFVF